MIATTAGRSSPENDRTVALAALRALVAALTRSARAIESHTGLTNAQLFLLRQFTTTAPLSINQLADLAQTRQNTVSSVVNHLVRARLVEKTRSPEDGRRAALTLTGKGRRLLSRAAVPPGAALIAGLNSLRAPDARKLADGLRALVAALKIEVDGAPLLFEEGKPRK